MKAYIKKHWAALSAAAVLLALLLIQYVKDIFLANRAAKALHALDKIKQQGKMQVVDTKVAALADQKKVLVQENTTLAFANEVLDKKQGAVEATAKTDADTINNITTWDDVAKHIKYPNSN